MADTVPQNGHGGTVDVHFDGKIAVITLRRGENRFNFELIEAYNKALDEVERNPEAAVLVTTSEGKYFSNGLDLEYMAARMGADLDAFATEFTPAFHGIMIRILTFPMPTVAALNGHAFAGGAMFALAHDYIIMQSGRGWWCLNEIFLNMPFTPFMMTLIRSKLTPSQLSEAAIFGRRFTAEDAKAFGIIEHTAPAGELMEVTKKFVSVFLAAPIPYKREAVFNMKNDMYADVVKLRIPTSKM